MSIQYRIHPAIGIARVGDSPDDYFIGPEAPRHLPSPVPADHAPDPHTKYRDAQNRIKRQGARFRVYETTTDASGKITRVREITAQDAEIEWQVHLANRKAAAPRFNKEGRRNEGIADEKLIIDAGAQKISGASAAMKLVSGVFMGMKVDLGDLLTDNAGRLIVLGGFGKSASVPAGLPIDNYSNNDGWHDDVSDGPVRATVRLKGANETVRADSAWVIVAPPAFAPEIENIITLYDIVYDMQAKFNPTLAVTDAMPLSFTRDIFPILRRTSLMHWVSDISGRGHAPAKRGHFLSRVAVLASNAEDARAEREKIFKRLRSPFGGGGNMPKLPAAVQDSQLAATVTISEAQYKRMELWAQGKFIADWNGAEPEPLPLEKIPVEQQPHALDRGALDACVGAGRFPGIEVGGVMLEMETFDRARPFRIAENLLPGHLGAQMALPWQADFRDCEYEEEIGLDWWPGQRPNDVYRVVNGELQRGLWVPRDGAWDEDDTRRTMMVDNWSKLGFVLKRVMDGEEKFVEEERVLE